MVNNNSDTFLKKIKQKYDQDRIAISAERIVELCSEAIDDFCSLDDLTDLDLVKQRQVLFEDMCNKHSDVIINNVMNTYFFAKYDTWKDSLQKIISDENYCMHWEYLLVAFKSKVRAEIHNTKNDDEKKYNGEFPDQLNFTVMEEVLENVGDCYYKEHTELFFLRYYFKRNTDDLVMGIKITMKYCQVIQCVNNGQTYKSMKLSPIVSADPEQKILLCSLTYNEWDSDTNRFINHGKNLSKDLSIIHYTTICRVNIDESEHKIFGFHLYNMYISLGVDSNEMKDAMQELIKTVLNTGDKYGIDKLSSDFKCLKLTFHQSNQYNGVVLSGVNRYANEESTTSTSNRYAKEESTTSTSNRYAKEESTTSTSSDVVITNFNDVYNAIHGGISELIVNFQNFLDIVWFYGDCSLLVMNLNILISRDSTTKKCLVSVLPNSDVNTYHIQDVFNILLFDVQPSFNVKCESTPYSFHDLLINSLNQALPSYIKNTHFKDYLQKTYNNSRTNLSKKLVNSIELGLVYLSNILIDDEYDILTFIKSLYEMFPSTNYSHVKVTDSTGGIDSVKDTKKRNRGRPKKDITIEKYTSPENDTSPEETIAKRLKSSIQRTCINNKDENVLSDDMDIDDDMDGDNIKTRLSMDSETDIQWNEKVSVQIPESIKNDLKDDILQHYEVDLNLTRANQTKKGSLHEFLENLLNSDKWKNSDLKKSFDLEFDKRRKTKNNYYGGKYASSIMYQLIMKSLGFKMYEPDSSPSGLSYYLKEKK